MYFIRKYGQISHSHVFILEIDQKKYFKPHIPIQFHIIIICYKHIYTMCAFLKFKYFFFDIGNKYEVSNKICYGFIIQEKK